MLMAVVLPAQLGLRNANISPLPTLKEMSWIATNAPKVFVRPLTAIMSKTRYLYVMTELPVKSSNIGSAFPVT